MASPGQDVSIYVNEYLLHEKLEHELLPSHMVVIPDTVADDVLKSLLSHPDLDELFDVESLLPHMMRQSIVTATDKCQIEEQKSPTAKVVALINAVKRKGQSKTKLTLLYASVYDSYEEQHGHGKHYDALRILLQKAWDALKIPAHQREEYQDPHTAFTKMMHTCGSRDHMKVDASKIYKNFLEKNPHGRIEDLIHAFLQRPGLGHLVSQLFPMCHSNPPSVWNIFDGIGHTWVEFALYLGYTKEQIASIMKQSPNSVGLQIRLFLREFQLPDMDSRTQSILVKATQNALKCGYKVCDLTAIKEQSSRESTSKVQRLLILR